MILAPTVTDAGLNALINAQGTGLAVSISHIALGAAGYNPQSSLTALVDEKMRVPVASGHNLGGGHFHVIALAQGEAEFFVREMGFVLEDGTLFAVWSDPSQILAWKGEGVDLHLGFDLSLTAMPAESVTVVTGELNMNLTMATEQIERARVHIRTMRRQIKLQHQLVIKGVY